MRLVTEVSQEERNFNAKKNRPHIRPAPPIRSRSAARSCGWPEVLRTLAAPRKKPGSVRNASISSANRVRTFASSTPHSQPLRGSLMWAARGASHLGRPTKKARFGPKCKHFVRKPCSHLRFQPPHSQPLRGSLMWAARGASHLGRPTKKARFGPKCKHFVRKPGFFRGVLVILQSADSQSDSTNPLPR
jgi:hypothetical protein